MACQPWVTANAKGATRLRRAFKIVLGRFLGYGILLTVGLAVIAGLSLIYVLRGVNPDAAYESQKARVPIYGALIGSPGHFSARLVEMVKPDTGWEKRNGRQPTVAPDLSRR